MMAPVGRAKRRLARLVQRLEEQDLVSAARRLESLSEMLDSAMEGTSWFERNRKRVAAVVSRHVENAETEVEETAHLLAVARRLMVERKPVPHRDMVLARRQMMDLLKTVPASALVAGTFLIPVPGAQPVLVPILMERLGLLPSAWLESELETGLRDLASLAQKYSLDDVAEELERMLADVRTNSLKIAELRLYIQDNPDWKVFFDEDLDEKISRTELDHLRSRVREMAVCVRESAGDSREWQVYFRGKHGADAIRGPLTFKEVVQRFGDTKSALVRSGDDSWWVPLWALLDEFED